MVEAEAVDEPRGGRRHKSGTMRRSWRAGILVGRRLRSWCVVADRQLSTICGRILDNRANTAATCERPWHRQVETRHFMAAGVC